jgi:hypothetical protein
MTATLSWERLACYRIVFRPRSGPLTLARPFNAGINGETTLCVALGPEKKSINQPRSGEKIIAGGERSEPPV